MSADRHALVVATGNRHKQGEFSRLLGGEFEVLGLHDLAASPPGNEGPGDVEESGDSFAANAEIKALHASRFTELPVIADDSGLCVDALDGAPGIRSARHGGPGLSDTERYQLILEETSATPDAGRGAHYEAAIALAVGGRLVAVESGRCDGRLLRTPQGESGFGYDPIFFLPDFDLSMAQLSGAEKDSISHRARALSALRKEIDALFG